MIQCDGEPYEYRISLVDNKGETVVVKTPDADGSFIFDEVIFGDYKLVITDNIGDIVKEEPLKIEEAFYSIDKPIEV